MPAGTGGSGIASTPATGECAHDSADDEAPDPRRGDGNAQRCDDQRKPTQRAPRQGESPLGRLSSSAMGRPKEPGNSLLSVTVPRSSGPSVTTPVPARDIAFADDDQVGEGQLAAIGEVPS